MTFLVAYLLSFAVGALALATITGKDKKIGSGLFFILAAGLGMGISAFIGFFSLPIFKAINPAFILAGHGVFIVALAAFCRRRLNLWKMNFPLNADNPLMKLSAVILFSVVTFAIWQYAYHYPFGGWDAWSCWNLKSRFLFLGKEHWTNMFSPLLWRSSPHYPLLLPLMNVWGWMFSGHPTYLVPLINSLLFTFLTAGLIFFALKYFSKNIWLSACGVLVIFTLPFIVTLSTSQYCDIVLAYYLTAGVLGLIIGLREQRKSFLFLGGLFLGFLGFTKPEGLVASLIVFALLTVYALTEKMSTPKVKRRLLFVFLAGFIIASLPTIIFQFMFAPGNQTFVNGLLSSDQPSNFLRLKIILGFYLLEPITGKWGSVWVLLVLGILLSKGVCFKKQWLMIPAFFLAYLSVITSYYWINTYFEISWWLSVTLSRILFSLLPLMIIWTLGGLGEAFRDKKESSL